MWCQPALPIKATNSLKPRQLLPNRDGQACLTLTCLPAWLAQARIYAQDLDAWAVGAPTAVQHPSVRDVASALPLKLFSLNDYLGLASHPDVCQAAALAASSVGGGAYATAIWLVLF